MQMNAKRRTKIYFFKCNIVLFTSQATLQKKRNARSYFKILILF